MRSGDIPSHVLAPLLGSLRIPNPEKPTALKERIWGAAQMPDEIELYWADGQDLVFPRGFLHAFTQGMSAYGYQIEWDDQRRWYEYNEETGEIIEH
jgi:hypothetical protein